MENSEIKTKREKRKVIQISAIRAPTEDTMDGVIALCNDGSMWFRYSFGHVYGYGRDWTRIPDVPNR